MTEKTLQELLTEVDRDAVAKLFIRSLGSYSYLVGLLAEVGRQQGYDLHKGDRVILHPKNFPPHLTLRPDGPILLSPVAEEDQLLFYYNRTSQ